MKTVHTDHEAPGCSVSGQAATVEHGEESSVYCLPVGTKLAAWQEYRMGLFTTFLCPSSEGQIPVKLTKNRPGDCSARESGQLEREGAAGMLYEDAPVESNWLPTSAKLGSRQMCLTD